MATTSTQQRDAAREISRAFLLAYNSGETDAIDDVVTEDFVAHHTGVEGDIHGAEEYKERVHELREAFPDFSMDEEVLLVDGDMGAGQYRWSGTHEGELSGIPPTGKRVETTTLTMSRMEDGKLAEMWIHGDGPGIMAQLGIEMGPK